MAEPATRPKYELAALSAKAAFMQVIPDDVKWNKEAMFALQILRGNADAFAAVDQDSIRNAITNLALIGSTLNPAMALAYLVPRKGKCCLDLSYRGLVRVATDSGGVLDVDATVVHEKDEFYYEMGLNPILKHVPSLEADPGAPTHVYAVALFPDRRTKHIVLNRKEVDKVKATSKARTGPWAEWEEEMWRKTAVKKLYKLLPQTDRMSTAVSIVNEQEGLMLPATAKERAGSFIAGIMGASTEKVVEAVDAEVITEGAGGTLPE